MNQYGMMLGDKTLATYHLDFRSSRGIAGGLESNFDNIDNGLSDNLGSFKSYYANDQDTTLTHNNRKREEPLSTDRYRLNLHHRIPIFSQTFENLFLELDINKLSDKYFYEDFFPEEYVFVILKESFSPNIIS